MIQGWRACLSGMLLAMFVSGCGGGGGGGSSGSGPDNPGSSSSSSGGASVSVTTLAGSRPGADGIAEGRFSFPGAIAVDGTSLYVADSDDNTIRKVELATRALSTIAGQAGVTGSLDATGKSATFNVPQGLAISGGNLYVADTQNHTIRRIVLATGAVTTLAGSAGEDGSGDGIGAAARFLEPTGLATDGTYLYVADTGNHTIRRIELATGQVTTLVGQAEHPGGDDDIGLAASFDLPNGIVLVGDDLYVTDSGNYAIRRVELATLNVSTVAGEVGQEGHDDGQGATARFSNLEGIAADGGNLYVTEGATHTVRRIAIATGAVVTLAGAPDQSGTTDAIGTSARFANPVGIAAHNGALYVADSWNETIRRIAPANADVSTFAGVPPGTDGAAQSARFAGPMNLLMAGGALYVADGLANTIRAVDLATGAVRTVAGQSGVEGSTDGASALFANPRGLAADANNIYVADSNNHTIRAIRRNTGAVVTLAGSAGDAGSADGPGTTARFDYPVGLATDGTNLYVADSHNQAIRKIVLATGMVSTLAGLPGSSGSSDGAGTSARFAKPSGLVLAGGYLYVTDYENHTIRRIDPNSGQVATLAGEADIRGAGNGIGAAAHFDTPEDVATDGSHLFVADAGNGVIRKIELASRTVTTLAGNTDERGSADGSGGNARFFYPGGVTVFNNALFVADYVNANIRRITY